MRKIETKKLPVPLAPIHRPLKPMDLSLQAGRFPSTLKRDWFLMASKNRPIRAAKRGSHFGSGWHEPGKVVKTTCFWRI